MAENGKREAAALLLAAGRTVRDAAAELGIGERTLHRWRDDAVFRKRETTLRGELLAAGLGKLSDTASAAAAVLRELLASESEGIKLAAARSVLQLGNDLRKTMELDSAMREISDRLAELESHAASGNEL